MSDNSIFRIDDASSRLPHLSPTSQTWQPESGLHFDTVPTGSRRHFSTQHRTFHPNPLFSKVKQKNATPPTPPTSVAEPSEHKKLGSERDTMIETLKEYGVRNTALEVELHEYKAALEEKSETAAKLSKTLKETEIELRGYKNDVDSIVSKQTDSEMQLKLEQHDQRMQHLDGRERDLEEETKRLKQMMDTRERELEEEAKRLKQMVDTRELELEEETKQLKQRQDIFFAQERNRESVHAAELKRHQEMLSAQVRKRDLAHAAQLAKLEEVQAASMEAKRQLLDERNEDLVWQRKEKEMADRYNNTLLLHQHKVDLAYHKRYSKAKAQHAIDVEQAKRGHKLREISTASYKAFADKDKSVLHCAAGFMRSVLPSLQAELYRLAQSTVDAGPADGQIRQAIETIQGLQNLTNSYWQVDGEMHHYSRRSIATQYSSSIQYEQAHFERTSETLERMEVANAAHVRGLIRSASEQIVEAQSPEPDWVFALHISMVRARLAKLRALHGLLKEPTKYQLLREPHDKEFSILTAWAVKNRQRSMMGASRQGALSMKALYPLQAKRVILLEQLGRTADLKSVALKARHDIQSQITSVKLELQRRLSILAKTETMQETGGLSFRRTISPRTKSLRLVRKTNSKPNRPNTVTKKQVTTKTKTRKHREDTTKAQSAKASAARNAPNQKAIVHTVPVSDAAEFVKHLFSSRAVEAVKKGRRRLTTRSPLALLSRELRESSTTIRRHSTMSPATPTQDTSIDGAAIEDAAWETCSELDVDDGVVSLQSQASPTAKSGSEQSVGDHSTVESSDEAVEDLLVALQYHIPSDAYTIPNADGSAATSADFSFRLYKHADGRPVKLHYHDTLKKAETAANMLLDEPVLGFDLEWEEFSKPGMHDAKRCVSMLQLANESGCHLFHLALFKGGETEDLISPSLRKLLSSSNIIKAGVNVAGDAGRVKTCFGIDMQGMFELSHLYKLVNFGANEPEKVNKRLVGLAGQVEELLRLRLDKGPVRTSAWSAKLGMQQLEYAASDAYAGFRLFHALEEKRRALQPVPPRPALWELGLPIELADGSLAQSRSLRKVVATATEEEDIFYDALEQQEDGEDTADDKSGQAVKTKSVRQTSEEVDRANDWIADWLPTQRSGLTPAPLRAYHLWQKQGFTVEETAAKLRQPPILSSTVAGYIADSISRGHLTYNPERLKVALQSLPASVLGRYRGLLAKLGSQLEHRTTRQAS